MPPIDEQSTDLTDEQIDQLVADAEKSPNEDIPMSDDEGGKEPEADAEKPAAEAPVPQAQPELIEFEHNGRKLKASLEDLKKWAQQGYDYPQKMSQLKQERQKWDQERQGWEKQWGQYRQVDQYAKQNPQWWSRVQELMQNGATQAQAQAQAGAEQNNIQPVLSKLNEQGQVIQELLGERQQRLQAEQLQKQQSEDTALDTEIKSIREQYKDLDFNQIDAEGKTLEMKVLEHCQKNGIASFKTGFRDFYHDQLIARHEQQAKASLSNQVQNQTKKGVLGQSPTPKKSLTAAADYRNKSYEDLTREALEELGLGA